jgi:hypothetical protein
MWTYEQSTGKLFNPAGVFVDEGYSGFGQGVNNPTMEFDPNVGPIPQGLWTIGSPYNSPTLGPLVLALTAMAGTQTEGRDLFRMHGDSQADLNAHLQDGSRGCIVIQHSTRIIVSESGDKVLNVVAVFSGAVPQSTSQVRPPVSEVSATPADPIQVALQVGTQFPTADDLNQAQLDLGSGF